MITNIKNKLKTILSTIDDFEGVYNYEPGKEGIPSKLPACTMITLGADTEFDEKRAMNRIYNVVIKVYIKLVDAEDTQNDVDKFIDLVLDKLQDYPDLSESCEYFVITSIEVEYKTAVINPVAIVNFYISVTEEIN